MKKMMMMIAVLATASAVQAASIAWGGYLGNSQDTVNGGTMSASGATLTLIYLGVSEPVGSITEWDLNTGLTNLGGTVLAVHNVTANEATVAYQAINNFARADSEGGVNGWWMIVAYDPDISPDYFGVYTQQVTGETDLSAGGTVVLQAGFGPGQYLDAGAQLQVVPEPATGMLALAGAALLLRRRRRA